MLDINKFENNDDLIFTLDAGGTNFVFSSIYKGKEIITPFSLKAKPEDISESINLIVYGFNKMMDMTGKSPQSISFAFPGPADYKKGIIGRLPNFSSDINEFPLSSYLENKFRCPVFINNDGNLFTFGEWCSGFLPYINNLMQKNNLDKRYKNLIGITLGTGFGSGIVINGEILDGDNGFGGNLYVSRNIYNSNATSESIVNKNFITQNYNALTNSNTNYSPKEIFEIADGILDGNKDAAIESFSLYAEVMAGAVCNALSALDSPIVIGGGIIKAEKFIIPKFLEILRSKLSLFSNKKTFATESEVYYIENAKEKEKFLSTNITNINVPDSEKVISYEKEKKLPIGISKLGSSKAISLGAYYYALNILYG